MSKGSWKFILLDCTHSVWLTTYANIGDHKTVFVLLNVSVCLVISDLLWASVCANILIHNADVPSVTLCEFIHLNVHLSANQDQVVDNVCWPYSSCMGGCYHWNIWLRSHCKVYCSNEIFSQIRFFCIAVYVVVMNVASIRFSVWTDHGHKLTRVHKSLIMHRMCILNEVNKTCQIV